MRWLAPLLVCLGLAACGGSGEKPSEEGAPKGSRIAESPFIANFDALEKRYLPTGRFAPGVDSIADPIHSGVHATLYYVATRGTIGRHVHRSSEESFFVFEGTGALLLAGRKAIPLEPGMVVRIPPGICHGYEGNPREPLKGILVTSPAWQREDAELVETDLPGATGEVYALDVTSEKALPPLDAVPRNAPADAGKAVVRKLIHQTDRSALQIAAVRRDRVPDHRHDAHDETVIVFAQAGFGFLRMGGVEHIVQAGTIAHIPQGTVHAFEHKAEGHARAISFFTPGYDGSDFHRVVHDHELNAPMGYEKTGYDEFKDNRPTRPKDQIRIGPQPGPETNPAGFPQGR